MKKASFLRIKWRNEAFLFIHRLVRKSLFSRNGSICSSTPMKIKKAQKLENEHNKMDPVKTLFKKG